MLLPARTLPHDAAKDAQICLVAVTIELREHAIAYAAGAVRESGATLAQVKCGVALVLGKTKA
jgi:hypothetical protein